MQTQDLIDWRMVFMLPPERRFTAAELARAQIGGVSRTLQVSGAVNLALPVLSLVAVASWRNPWHYTLVLLLLTAGHLAGALATWQDPSSRAARLAYWGLPFTGALALGLMTKNPVYDRESIAVLAVVAVLASMTLILATLHRHHYIVQRLREADERDKAVEMAQRLAGAQLEPHFLFNTLASVQHWVDTKDDRAAPLLAALTGYLRATLPMFKKPLLPLRDELLAVERYLQVMQARLGVARLDWQIDVDALLLARAQLPPGVLLTLVENAVAHGIEVQISGGRLTMCGHIEAGNIVLTVTDNGPGPAADSAFGVGLSNARERLRLMCGDTAQLLVTAAPGGGCQAQVRAPMGRPP
jgi:hypothetical protein